MRTIKQILLPAVFGFFVGCIYWFATMGSSSIYGINIFHLFIAAAFFGAMMANMLSSSSVLRIAFILTLAAEFAIILKIAYDIHFDTSSHNLLGLDIIMSMFVIAPSSLVGGYVGKSISTLIYTDRNP